MKDKIKQVAVAMAADASGNMTMSRILVLCESGALYELKGNSSYIKLPNPPDIKEN